MKNNLLKLCSSILLLVSIFIATHVKSLFLSFGIVTCILCFIKFLIVMILEPDNLFEIIKKFIYLFVMIAIILGMIFSNKICFIILEIIILIDTLLEILRFIKNSKNA